MTYQQRLKYHEAKRDETQQVNASIMWKQSKQNKILKHNNKYKQQQIIIQKK